MTTISQRELRNDNAAIVRRVEAGESFTVTRRGVPVADLVPHGSVRPDIRFTAADAVVVAFAGAPIADPGAWLRDIRAVDELLDDADRDPWAARG
ncbi:type II toxin-antitoxin system Phd/YefM family antitoxin [Nocardioides nitrophenolicus]|uniref:type II toxin-antitoxin system Phd/YefM family antitoxin n=1 Tax=Nocardioides nitrophenolicus TaxID=60489 RepID=UPI001958C0D3|nr:type II toxin-antitoxin system prevent-host-death family antitoxin [Nocardioides nitrophenolicus]MBM7515922.1 prevent-host-death family protein [Nocardioides nitrophenolicus]